MTFAPIDALFIIIILVIAVIAAARGLIKEFFSKAALICGLAIAVIFSPRLAVYAVKTFPNKSVANVLSFLILFIAVFLVVKIIQQLFSKAFSGEMLRGLDRSLGLLFGLVEGVVVVAFIILVMISQPWVDFRSALDGSFFDKILSSVIAQPAAYIKGMAA